MQLLAAALKVRVCVCVRVRVRVRLCWELGGVLQLCVAALDAHQRVCMFMYWVDYPLLQRIFR